MFPVHLRRAGVLAFSLFSLAVAATDAQALSAPPDRFKDLTVEKRFARQRAAQQVAMATSAPDRGAAKARRRLDFSRMGASSTFSAPSNGRSASQFAASRPKSPYGALPARAPAREASASAFVAPATPSPQARLAAAQPDPPRATGSLYTGLTQGGSSSYGWLVTVNVKGVLSPKYTGSASYGFVGYPTLSFRRPGMPEKWSSPDDSITFNAYENDRFVIGPALAYRGGRYAGDAPELGGIHKPRWTLEGGVFADFWIMPDRLRLRAEARRGMRAKDGVNGYVGLDYIERVGKFTLALGPRLKFGNDSFMRNQFGVTAADSARNPAFAAYEPKAGLYAVGAYGSATYKVNDVWAVTVHGGYDRLRGQAGASPIVKEASGSRDQWSIGAIVSYTFGIGGARVSDGVR